MRKKFMVLISGALSLAFCLVHGESQRAWGQASYDYNTSSLMQAPSDAGQNPQMPQAYYPYWTNYLDNLQREGGYYSYTGNYGSTPVTSYYPANPSSNATSPQVTNQSGMYYNPQDYYSATQQQGYYQQAPQASPYQSYQAPSSSTPHQAAVHGKKSSKKHRAAAEPTQTQQPTYYGQPQTGYYTQQAGAPQQQAYGQYPNYQQQQAYGQYQQQPSTQGTESAFGSDPSVQAAQQRAYERAAAREKAAELAAQQQQAMEELQKTQQMYVAAQQKLREQEQKQRELQSEYHKKAVKEAYDSLRVAQQKYYELMGVSGENAAQGQASVPAQQQAAAPQYPQPAPAAQPQTYPQSVPTANYGSPAPQAQPSYPGSAGVNTATAPPTGAPSAYPPGQATPLQIQPQQQSQQESSSGGFWGVIKEIFSPPTTGPVPNQRGMWEAQKPRDIGG
ncbi:MAG: hypothetical protein ACP5U1_07180 [Desulfomonilaceae bacterium]